jgi:hypothetical protein
MRIILPLFMLLPLSSTGFPPAIAADAPDVTVRCLGAAEAAGRAVNAPLCFFDDRAPAFEASVTAPLGTHLGLFGEVIQTTSGGLSARLLKNISVSQELQFDTRTQLIAACDVPGLPLVDRPTRLLLRLYIHIRGQPEPVRAVGTVDLFDYPRQSAADWERTFAATVAQGGLARVAVFGSQDALRRFFQRQQIRFDDLGSDWPDALDPKCLYLADSPSPKPDRIASLTGAHLALFFSGAADGPPLPGIYSVSDIAGGSVVKVTLPALLDRLDADPGAQQMFLEIVRQALNRCTPAAP